MTLLVKYFAMSLEQIATYNSLTNALVIHENGRTAKGAIASNVPEGQHNYVENRVLINMKDTDNWQLLMYRRTLQHGTALHQNTYTDNNADIQSTVNVYPDGWSMALMACICI